MANDILRDVLTNVSDLIRPPTRLSVSECVAKSLIVSSGGSNGLWSPNTTPYMVEPLNCVADREFQIVAFMGSARSGKSLALVDGIMTYKVVYNPSDILFVFPTAEMTAKFSKLRISRAIINSPDLRDRISTHSHDNNITSKLFKNGMAVMLSHPSRSALSGNDYSLVTVSDHDRLPSDSNSDGNIVGQAGKRVQTYGRTGCLIVESSPSRDLSNPVWTKELPHDAPPVDGIAGLYNRGDKRIYQWECPHCHDPISMYPDLELFCLPKTEQLIAEIKLRGVSETADKYNMIFCQSCGGGIEFKHRQSMNEGGYWKKEDDTVTNNIASFWQSGLIARFQTWHYILEKEFAGLLHYSNTGDESPLKTTRNVDQGRPFSRLINSNSVTISALMRRADKRLGNKVVPKGVRFLLASIDVQGKSFVVQIIGHGVNNERWVVDRYDITRSKRITADGQAYENIEPAVYEEDWDLILTDVINSRYPLQQTKKEINNPENYRPRTMKVYRTCVDSNGVDGVTDLAYLFYKKLEMQGIGYKLKLVHGYYANPTKANTPYTLRTLANSSAAKKIGMAGQMKLYMVNTNMIKDILMSSLMKTRTGKGYINFPDWLDKDFYTELLVEVREDKGWVNLASARNETMDLFVYDDALYRIVYDESFLSNKGWNKPPLWAMSWESNTMVQYEKVEEKTFEELKAEELEMLKPKHKLPVKMRSTVKPRNY